MIINLIVPDKIKRAIRYLDLTNEQFEEFMVAACKERMENVLYNAKAKHAETQTMEIIDPEPV